MSGEQFASPPCFLHELDPDFVMLETPKLKEKKDSEAAVEADTDDS